MAPGMDVDTALKARVSVRAFLPDAVPEALVREILEVARFAPSGGNLQPWKVIAVAGAAREAVQAIGLGTGEREAEEDGVAVYPANLWEPYRSRRFKNAEDMYGVLGIPREDKVRRLAQFGRNALFFGAPVGLFFVTDRRFAHGQWMHIGMLLQSIALAATARGLGTCMQEFWSRSRTSLHQHFKLEENDILVCGMALGYADPNAPINSYRTERAAVDDFATFEGF